MQPTQSILDLEIEDWRGTTGAVHPTAGTTGYFDEASFGNGVQPRSSPVDSPTMISMSVASPFINNSYQKQQQYNPGHRHLHIASLQHHPNTHNHHQQQQDAVSTHHHAHNHGQNHYDMDVDSLYHNSYSNPSYGQQQQIHSPSLSPQRHIHGNVGQHEVAAVCDPRFVSGHHDFFSPSHPHASINGVSGTAQHQSTALSNPGSKSSSPTNIDHADAQNPQIKLEGDAEDLVYPPNDSSFPPFQRPQPLTVVIPSPTNTLHDMRLKRKFSSNSDASQSEFFDPGYSLTSAVRVELDGGIVVSPTALISPLERTDLDFQDHEGDIEAYSDADGDSEEYDYDYDDLNDSEFVPRSRPSVARRTSHQHLSTQPQQHSPQQAWLGVSSQPAGRRRAATSPSVAAHQTYQPQPSYPWGYSHDITGSSLDDGFSSNGTGVVRSRSGTTAGMDHSHRYNPYPTGGYPHSCDAPQPIGHSASYDSTTSSTSYVDDLAYSNQPTYPSSLELSLPSLRTRRASTSTSTTSTTTPTTPLTPLTPLSTGGGESQVGVHVHGYATRSGGVSHAYSPSTPSLYDSSPNGFAGQIGSLSPNGMGGGSKRRSRPSTSLPVPVPVPNLTKKSRGRRVPTVYQSNSSNAPSVNTNKGARIHMCKVAGCGKCFARGEHLKRHVRSIHTWEKPHKCPYPGCGKDFSRHDNLGQHMRVHKDYNPRI